MPEQETFEQFFDAVTGGSCHPRNPHRRWPCLRALASQRGASADAITPNLPRSPTARGLLAGPVRRGGQSYTPPTCMSPDSPRVGQPAVRIRAWASPTRLTAAAGRLRRRRVFVMSLRRGTWFLRFRAGCIIAPRRSDSRAGIGSLGDGAWTASLKYLSRAHSSDKRCVPRAVRAHRRAQAYFARTARPARRRT